MAGINSIGSSDYSWLFSTKAQRQDSISQLWTSYNNYHSNATSTLAGISEINTNLRSLMSSYDDAKSAFNAEFEENMSDLSESAKQVSRYSFKVPPNGAITKTETTDANGIISTSTTYSKDLQSALDAVSNFVSNYNSSLQFLNDNASVSRRVENLANTFGDTTYRASSYEAIGISVQSNGMLEVNEEMLANAIVNDPDKVSSVLGADGLAGKAEQHVSFATFQQDRLFPTAQAMLGDQINAASLYTSNAYLAMSSYASVGNLVNMLF